MPAAGDFFEKVKNNYVKTKKNSPPQAKIFKIWYFLTPGDCIFIMKSTPHFEKQVYLQFLHIYIYVVFTLMVLVTTIVTKS